MTFGEKGCRNATTDFDKLFFISTEHALHLCMGLMKEERAVLLAKLRARARLMRVCSCVKASRRALQYCVTQGILCLSFRLSYKRGEVIESAWETKAKT